MKNLKEYDIVKIQNQNIEKSDYMARRGRRYDDEPKLNMKKVFGVILVFVLIIASIKMISNILKDDSKNTSSKIENIRYYAMYDNGKWGVINSHAETVIKPKYDEMIVIPNEAQDIFVCITDANYGNGDYKTKVINSKGKETIKDYDKIEAIANYDADKNIWYEDNVFRVQKDGKFGLINYSGKKLLECEYDSINPIYGIENSLVIEKDGKFGLSDDSGNIVLEPKYKQIDKIGEDYKNGYIVVNDNNKYGIIGFDKSNILDIKYDDIKGITGENLYAVKENGKYTLVDKSGEKKINKDFEDVLEISNEGIVAKMNTKYGVTDLEGNTKISFKYDELKHTKGNNFIAKDGNKYGVVDLEGTVVFPIESTKIEYISSGNFIISDTVQDGKTVSKVYNEEYQEKITGEILEINTSKGYIKVKANDEYKYYNFKFEEKAASQLLTTNKLFVSKKDGKYGFIDESGKVVVDYIYDDATEQNINGYAGIKKDGVWGAIDVNGKVVVEPKYNLDKHSKIDFIGAWHLCEDTNANYYLDV